MTRKTRKVGPVGRLGVRYGVRIRRRIQEVEEGQRGWHRCPKCAAESVRREASGIWACRRCGVRFAGGAYRPIVTTSVKREVPAAEAVAEAAPEEAK
jgi:large subunit ribosomal protein L37Ae